ncbi:DUF2239 family protein [Noviherbaspirillum denitrificans]|uniref:DUF2239 domain-containing protein n=1 Tax=Noviherbaspirillum denitrificans TaxID=1968433 RepID=A0A254TI11_9BURK|nr:DUF2239 family protein [Noviherbaspirillum denitrificans]OWW22280.1 hypothetical protein AYR66_25050 [Noviherbaspirillum denitrificans]
MSLPQHHTYTAFYASKVVASGKLSDVAVVLHGLLQRDQEATPLILDDETGKQTELDLRGTAADVQARYVAESLADAPALPEEKPAKAGRGRPRLGVVPREVTLLPEHWDWLASQPGGASVALRKLVHEARRASTERDQRRHAQERSYNAMAVLAGNFPGFEEASRALFAGEPERLANIAAAWPADVRDYVLALANP